MSEDESYDFDVLDLSGRLSKEGDNIRIHFTQSGRAQNNAKALLTIFIWLMDKRGATPIFEADSSKGMLFKPVNCSEGYDDAKAEMAALAELLRIEGYEQTIAIYEKKMSLPVPVSYKQRVPPPLPFEQKLRRAIEAGLAEGEPRLENPANLAEIIACHVENLLEVEQNNLRRNPQRQR